MPPPATVPEFVALVRKSEVVDAAALDAYLGQLPEPGPDRPGLMAGLLVRDRLLTRFQAEQLVRGRWRGFRLSKYTILDRLGAGGMGHVYLCEHRLLRRRMALKVLPKAQADDPSARERFYREARAVAALDHPNIVRAYDIDHQDDLYFLVMEYIEGVSFQELVRRQGPVEVGRAADYVRQAAAGLQHAHETAGIVHRDIKPGNILVDQAGVVKVLDMGLARFFYDDGDVISKKYDQMVLGTADYLAPEQALLNRVDIRADVYSLGATFYYLLTGGPPFGAGTPSQKLMWHQVRQPKPVRSRRPEVPEGLAAVVDRMMAKDPAHRFQTPGAVAEALAPWAHGGATPVAG